MKTFQKLVAVKTPQTLCLPVLLDVEGPLELQVGLLIVIDELGDGVVVTTSHHARRCGLCLDCFDNVSPSA